MVTIVLVTGSGPKCPRKTYYTLLTVLSFDQNFVEKIWVEPYCLLVKNLLKDNVG